MDWDEPQKQPSSTIVLGEDLSTQSIEDLETRILALEGEVARCREAIAKKRAQRAAANSVFKS